MATVLGVSAYYHDSAACLVQEGRIVAAAQEDRFTRKKHDARFPARAVEYCLAAADLSLGQVDLVVFYEKPFLKFERLLETYLSFAPRGFASFRKAMPLWLKEKLFQKRLLSQEFQQFSKDFDPLRQLRFVEHHTSHAASAFFPSPFDEAVVLTMDGVGEWATTSAGFGRGSTLSIDREIHFPHSLGLLYSAFTYYTGFSVNSGEYKVMGLAPYGRPTHVQAILDELIDLKEDGSFRLNLDYFDYATGLRMTNRNFDRLFGGPPRSPEAPLTQKEMDLAASVQAVVQEAVLRLTRALRKQYSSENLCLAGGVALNCVANGAIARERIFENIWIQPAAGDAGGAIGAALAAHFEVEDTPRVTMSHAYFGPEFSKESVRCSLEDLGADFEVVESNEELLRMTCDAIVTEKTVGWFQGRMEFGPRALGNRSILASPQSADMQRTLNLKIKFRESFRPFAPAVRVEDADKWFDIVGDSPYMLMTFPVREQRRHPIKGEAEGLDLLRLVRSDIPAVTHVDYSARVQTVSEEANPLFHRLLTLLGERTGCPVTINTSFNIRGEPIVCTPENAYRCFMGTDLDVLVVENCFMTKARQPEALRLDYRREVDLD